MKRAVTFSECFTFTLHIVLLLARNEQCSYKHKHTHARMQTPSTYTSTVWFRPVLVYVCMWCKCVLVRRIFMYVGNRTEQSSACRAEYAHQLIIVIAAAAVFSLFLWKRERLRIMCVQMCVHAREWEREINTRNRVFVGCWASSVGLMCIYVCT